MLKKIVIALTMLALIEIASAATCNSISQFGITWTFDKAYECGQFANGDWWVVGPVTITDISPESFIGDGIRTQENDTWVVQPGRIVNGSMKNIDSAIKQHGYDNAISSFGYNESLNAARKNNAPISASNPLQLESGTSLVSTISLNHAHPEFRPSQGPVLKTAAILTVLNAIPSEGSFRPPYSGNDKAIKFSESQLNYELLAELDREDFVDSSYLKMEHWTDKRFSSGERMVDRPWIDHFGGGMGDVLMPYENGEDYPGYRNRYLQDIALLLNVDWAGSPGFTTNDEYKRDLLVSAVQLGIDNYGVYQSGPEKVGWHAGGGHGISRKWPILFAGVMLDGSGAHPDAAEMADISYSDIDFAEENQVFYVNQSILDAQNKNYSTGNHCNPSRTIEWGDPQGICFSSECDGSGCANSVGPDYRADFIIPYSQEDADNSLPEWRMDNAREGRANRAWLVGVGYREGQTYANFPGIALSLHIMNLTEKWDHPVFFDYMDRYIEIEKEIRKRHVEAGGDPRYGQCMWNYTTRSCEPGINFNIPGTPAVDIRGNVINELFERHYVCSSEFAENVWNEYRSQYGCVWQYDDIADIGSKWHYDCDSQAVYCTGASAATSCSQYPNQMALDYDPCKVGPCDGTPLQCQGTDISCGTYPSCQNCNALDACSGTSYLDYYCNGTSCAYNETANEPRCTITECIDNTKLLDYISQWKQGSLTMLVLMQRIAQWKTGC